jgi:hypothetical protein
LSATANSFQLKTKHRTAVVARPGATMGTTMRHSTCGVVQPSMRAASSSSTGISLTNTDISQIPTGRLSTRCASTRPAWVLSSPRVRNITYHGPTTVIGGSMWKTSDHAITAAGTHRGQPRRASE